MSSVTLEQVQEQKTYDKEHPGLLLAGESSLRKDWETPEEDAAW